MSAGPGWYPTARDGTDLRWWDGTRWTEHTCPDPRLQLEAARATATAVLERANEASAPPGWYSTGTEGQHLRWWDGAAWTAHILKRGYGGKREQAKEPAAQPPGIPMMVTAFASFGLGFGLNILVVVLLEHAGSPGGDAVKLLLGEFALWIPLILTPIVVSKRRGTGSLAADYGLRFSRKDWGIGIIGSFIGRGATAFVLLPLLAAFSRVLKNPQVGTPVDQISGWTVVVFGLVACIGAPIIEELYFRGMIQTRMIGRYGVVRGIAITSVLFGSAHLIGWQGPGSLIAAASIAGGGAVLGYVRYRTGRLGASMVTHMFFNLFVFVLVAAGSFTS